MKKQKQKMEDKHWKLPEGGGEKRGWMDEYASEQKEKVMEEGDRRREWNT